MVSKIQKTDLIMICASCGKELAGFKSEPKSTNYKDCDLLPIYPLTSIIPGSTQVCPYCGGFVLLVNETKQCEQCGYEIKLPPGGVLTNKGPLSKIINLSKKGGEKDNAMDSK